MTVQDSEGLDLWGWGYIMRLADFTEQLGVLGPKHGGHKGRRQGDNEQMRAKFHVSVSIKLVFMIVCQIPDSVENV